jgi:hypothetical protein
LAGLEPTGKITLSFKWFINRSVRVGN